VRNQSYTLMVVGGAHQDVRRLQVRRSRVLTVLAACGVVLVALCASVVHYAFIVDAGLDARAMRASNEALRLRLAVLNEKTSVLTDDIRSIETADEELRMLADLPARSRELAMGPLRNPVGAAGGGASDIEPFSVALDAEGMLEGVIPSTQLLEGRVDVLRRESDRARRSLQSLVGYYTAREQLLASTPSVWPTRGWITSVFGSRDDPFTGGRVMHAGIDLAAAEGTQVVAPAAGTITQAGDNGGYGNFIAIDHGRGIVTQYGHLSRVLVKTGDKVTRGQHIGAIGNTGRSTGPHLHYEVRLNGLPVNPRNYVIEW
jgi:murein DD-endopeptidase MepM/ murein hydrolase activator NlpD